ncbi:MFS transporter [Thiomonas bhubaneswarensis]|uniref:Sugar (And other) transporter n=1 Tax=Thiomonas bhubaneswarensis TaxID=339866 RepID=A0A0K6HXS1_9BURK|nr:MFS transporter [Thiomonas bhubaneswarensis]CUA95675.1 Sugar (and other) transporter [Thiomonas bhubaneswarensis]
MAATVQTTPGGSAVHPDHAQIVALLDDAPMRLPHYLAWALSSGGTLIDGISVFMLGIAMPLLTDSLGLSPLQTGLLGAALVAGAIGGAVLGGRLADRIGRKSVFLLDMALLAAAAGFSALTWNAWGLIAAQFVVGVGIGMDFPVSGSYVAECMPHKKRSVMMVATIACQSVGLLVAALLAMALLHLQPEPTAWRWFFAAEMLTALLFLLGRLNLPESPRWLIGQGRNREAVHMLERFVPSDRRQLERMASRLGSTVHYVARVPQGDKPHGYAVLFQPAYLRRTLLSAVPWFLMDIATYGVGLFTAVLLAQLHFTGRDLSLVQQVAALVRGTGLIDLFLLLGFALGLWTVARFGRIRMQLAGFAGMTLGMGLLWLSTVTSGMHVPLIFAGFIVFNLSMNMGPNSTTYILPTELYPTQLRATGAGFAAAVAKIGATLGVFALPLVKSALGVPMVLAMMAACSLLGLLATWAFSMYGHGLTLEEHQTQDLPRHHAQAALLRAHPESTA